eukprot:9440427-Pyramimonas_sp.AAC.3
MRAGGGPVRAHNGAWQQKTLTSLSACPSLTPLSSRPDLALLDLLRLGVRRGSGRGSGGGIEGVLTSARRAPGAAPRAPRSPWTW